ncbi:MAG: hypothetical protein OD918_08710 [Gammaproteobacteria bacterium]
MAADTKRQKDPKKSGAQELAAHSPSKALDAYEKEVQNRRDEILFRKADSQNQKEISVRSIDAHLEDRQRARVFGGKESSKHKIFIGVIVTASMAFISVLIMQGQTRLAEMLVSLAGGAVLGAFGGYGYAMQKSVRGRNQLEE